jgi:uncharacterized membrane protein YcaP (DUF421 family)
MKPEEIRLDDWQRILFGNISPLFLVEVFIRTLIMYLLLLAVVRWLGKRMSGQLTIIEMTVMITLGAIVSVPMQMPDRGLLQGVLILLVALGLHRGINHLAFFSPKTNAVLQGKPTLVVKNGVIQLNEMQEVRISKQQLFSELRTKNVSHLGVVKRMYLEAAGSFSILHLKEPLQGLPVFPPNDDGILTVQKYSDEPLWACQNCGCLAPVDRQPCKICSENLFIKAISS